MAIKNVVLIGATGTLGSEIYKALKASPSNFEIAILTRPESKSALPDGAKVIRLAYDDPALVDALRGQDAVVSAVNGMATLSQISLIVAAVKAGVKKFIPSEFGSDTLNPVVSDLFSWYADMRTVYDHLVKAADQNPGFSYCGLITGPLFDWGIKTGMLGYDLASHTAAILDGGSLPVSYTDIPQAALGVARALERDVSGYLKISSVTVSQNEILASLEKVTGRKWERKEESTKRYHKMSEELMKSGDGKEQMEGAVLRILRIAYGEDCVPNWGAGDNARLGLQERSLDDLVRDALGREYK